MIHPQSRLLYWFALIVPPFVAVGTLFAAVAGLSAGAVVLFVLIALTDGVLAVQRSRGIRASFPAVVRLSRDKQGAVEFALENAGKKKAAVRIGFAFPDAVVPEREDFDAEIPGGGDAHAFSWAWTGRARGHYRFENCYLETASPLGFWSARTSQAIAMEVRVYPNLAAERKTLAAYFLNRGTAGIHTQRQIGQGREFEKLREYVPGDSYDHVHWKATARRSRPITKVFQIERTQEVYVVVDASRLSARPSHRAPEDGRKPDGGGETVLERYINTALIVGLIAERQGDAFGLLTFDSRVRHFVKAKSGKAHFNACRDALYTLQPRTVNPDFDDLFAFIGERLRRRALVIFLTGLDDPVLAEGFLKNVAVVDRKHVVLVNMMKPDGMQGLFSGPPVRSLDDIYRDLAGHIALNDLLEIQKRLRLRGVYFTLPEHDKFCTDVVAQYMTVKQRQLL